jgi:hypothetical protein
MRPLRYTLVADGSSDRVLIPLLNWLLDRADIRYQDQFADRLPSDGNTLKRRAAAALRLYPCDLLFVHRDGEGQGFDERVKEIQRELADANNLYVPIVPVRMTEAWLLSSETAIRRAAGNPNGKMPLGLPTWREWDQKPDPKQILFDALRNASGLQGRHLRRFHEHAVRHRVAELTGDFSPLEKLPAFAHLRDAVDSFVADWKSRSGLK